MSLFPARGWLHEYLVEASTRNLCMQVYCTTCGSGDFRRGLRDRLSSAVGGMIIEASPVCTAELVRQLGGLTPDPSLEDRFWDAVQLILCDLHSRLDGSRFREEVQLPLAGTWSGEVLESMWSHERRLSRERSEREAYESPDAVDARRAEKKRLKQEAHEERLARKEVRDREWRERNGLS